MASVMNDLIVTGFRLAALSVSSRIVLKSWIALQSAPHPDKIIPRPTPPRWKRLLSTGLFIIFELFILFVIPRLHSQALLDSFWVTFCLGFNFLIILSATETLRSGTKWIEYTQFGNAVTRSVQPLTTTQKRCKVLASGLAVAAWVGNTYAMEALPEIYEGSSLIRSASSLLQGGVAGCWVVFWISNLKFPVLKFRWLVLGLLAYEATCVILGLSIYLIFTIFPSLITHFPGYSRTITTTTTPQPDGTVEVVTVTESNVDVGLQMTKWVMKLMGSYIENAGFAISGVLVAILMRFDWMQHQSKLETPFTAVPYHEVTESTTITITDEKATATPSHPTKVLIPTLPRFPKKTYKAAYVFLAISLIAGCFSPWPQDVINSVLAVTGLPILAGVVLIRAWFKGECKALWMYEERWVLSKTPEAGEEAQEVPTDAAQQEEAVPLLVEVSDVKETV